MDLEQDIKTIQAMDKELSACKEVEPFDPIKAVEESLLSFMEFRLTKLRNEMEFQEEIRDTIRARIPEADFNDLRVLLDQEQQNTNRATQNILTPFIPKVQEVTPNKKQKQIEEQIFEDSAKDNLQAFNEMFQMFNEIKKTLGAKKDTSAIKKALEQSVVSEQNIVQESEDTKE